MLEVENIKKYYASQKAVDEVSFSVSPGSIFGLLGPNGAGKTTLIRMLTGIFFPDEGSIRLNGQRFEPLRDMSSIGYMPEERGLYKKMRIGEQVVYLAQLKGLSKTHAIEKAREWFIKLEMQSWWNKKVEDLSKGMAQKLQFVITVLHEPSLIILDEPFSGLDPVNANLIKEEIFQLARKGSSIIFSTHRMEQVEEICDHIILMNKGKKILDGTVKEIRQQFKENLFSLTIDQLVEDPVPASFEVMSQKDHTLIVKISQGATSNDVLRFYLQKDILITSFYELLPSMNEIFIRLVEGQPGARQFEKVTA